MGLTDLVKTAARNLLRAFYDNKMDIAGMQSDQNAQVLVADTIKAGLDQVEKIAKGRAGGIHATGRYVKAVPNIVMTNFADYMRAAGAEQEPAPAALAVGHNVTELFDILAKSVPQDTKAFRANHHAAQVESDTLANRDVHDTPYNDAYVKAHTKQIVRTRKTAKIPGVAQSVQQVPAATAAQKLFDGSLFEYLFRGTEYDDVKLNVMQQTYEKTVAQQPDAFFRKVTTDAVLRTERWLFDARREYNPIKAEYKGFEQYLLEQIKLLPTTPEGDAYGTLTDRAVLAGVLRNAGERMKKDAAVHTKNAGIFSKHTVSSVHDDEVIDYEQKAAAAKKQATLHERNANNYGALASKLERELRTTIKGLAANNQVSGLDFKIETSAKEFYKEAPRFFPQDYIAETGHELLTGEHIGKVSVSVTAGKLALAKKFVVELKEADLIHAYNEARILARGMQLKDKAQVRELMQTLLKKRATEKLNTYSVYQHEVRAFDCYSKGVEAENNMKKYMTVLSNGKVRAPSGITSPLKFREYLKLRTEAQENYRLAVLYEHRDMSVYVPDDKKTWTLYEKAYKRVGGTERADEMKLTPVPKNKPVSQAA